MKPVDPQEFPASPGVASPDRAPKRPDGNRALHGLFSRPRTAAIVAIVVVLGVGTCMIVSTGDSGGGQVPPAGPAVVQPGDLMAFGVLVGHPVFWAGARQGTRLEFRDDGTGNVHVRYLTGNAPPGVDSRKYLNISTYPFSGALAATRALARTPGFQQVRVAGGIGFLDPERPNSVVVAWSDYPDVQVDVYDPVRYRALEVVRSGAITPVSLP